MSYVDAFHDTNRDCIELVERVNGERDYKTYPARYVLYYPDNKGKYKSIFGSPLTRVTHTSGKVFHKDKKIYGHKRLFESDIKPVFRCLSENYLGKQAPELHICFLDIEVDFDKERGFSDPKDPFSKITAITIYLNWMERCITLVNKPDKMDKNEATRICEKYDDTMLCDTEEEMLEMFLQLVDDVDVFSGWNSEGYDLPYIVNRITRIIGKEHTRRLCLWGQYPQEKMYEKFGKEQQGYVLCGKVHLDYLELYRKYTYHELHSYRLDHVGEIEIGENKVPYEGTIDQLYNNDFEKFIAYNRQDVMMLVKIDEKNQYIDLANVLAHDNTVLLPTTLGAVAVGDQAVINEAWAQGLQVPDKNKGNKDQTAAGAYVAQPKTGLHEWIGSVDLNSLYPSVIRAMNMSTETLVGQIRLDRTNKYIEDQLEGINAKAVGFADAWADRFDTMEFELVNNKDIAEEMIVDFEDGNSIKMTGAQIYDLIHLSGNPWGLTANGTIFRYDEKGIIPGLLERWYAERKVLQKQKRDAVDEKEVMFWDKRQLIKKINLNSLYGTLLNVGSRFFDIRMGQSTTLGGRTIARHMAAKLNESLTGEYDHKGDTIIYGDTDSAYFTAFPIFKEEINKGELEWNKDKAIELYDAVCEQVNESFPQFMHNLHGIDIDHGKIIAAGREAVAERGLFIKKKRYGLLVYDMEGERVDKDGKSGKLKAMGLDLKRSDTPEFMQQFLESILLDLLEGRDEIYIRNRILEFRKAFKDRPGWEKGTPKRVNNLTKYTKQYDKTGKCGVGHVMAAINWNRLKKAFGDQYSMNIVDGMKTIVCRLKDNPMNVKSIGYPIDELHLPKWYKDLPFDDAHMESTIIDNKIENLIGILDWDLQATKQATTFSSLFEVV